MKIKLLDTVATMDGTGLTDPEKSLENCIKISTEALKQKFPACEIEHDEYHSLSTKSWILTELTAEQECYRFDIEAEIQDILETVFCTGDFWV